MSVAQTSAFLHAYYSPLGRWSKESGPELRSEPSPWPLHLLYNQFGPGGSIPHKSLWEECKVRWWTRISTQTSHANYVLMLVIFILKEQHFSYMWFSYCFSKMQVYIFFSFSYSVTYTRNLNKSGKTALLCCFISSITVVAQYTIYYKNELDLKKRKMRIGFNCPSLAAWMLCCKTW